MREMRAIALSLFLTCVFGITVNTTCGPVEGLQTRTPDGSTVDVFKAIPFATPPLGGLRWAPPQPMCWTGTYNATYFRGYCIQANGAGDENCLYLDVHRPPGLGQTAPVVFYIHGGSLVDGAGQFEYVDVLATRLGAIVVTTQYRLGALGWLCIPGIPTCNVGLLDQQAALRWVRDNIAAFGGDPSRVTVAGQSSGGTSIFALLSSPASAGLFAAAWSMSGSPNISVSLSAAYAQNENMTAAAGCAPQGSSPAQQIACMRKLPAAKVNAVMPASWYTPGLWGIQGLNPATGRLFGGLPVVDGTVITQPFTAALASGLVDVPVVIGAMGQECDLAPGQNVEGLTQVQWKAVLQDSVAAWNDPAFEAALWNAYLPDSTIATQRGFDAFNTDYGILCANAVVGVGAAASPARKAPTYLYVDQWAPSSPIPRGGGFSTTQAFHTFDWGCACENWGSFGPEFPASSDSAHAALMQMTMREFVSTGRVTAYGWRPVDGVPGFPAHHGTLVMGTPVLPPHVATAFVADYRTDICGLLQGHGFECVK